MLVGLVKIMPLAPHPQFNHNDLHHVFALVSLAAFYLGGCQLTDRTRDPFPKDD
jgi:hypothetical protein